MTTLTTHTPPRVYVACLAAYNAGILHGAWIDANEGTAYLQQEIAAMLATSPEPDAEEWAIHDHEGFGSCQLGEGESLDTVSQLARLMDEHGGIFDAAYAITGTLDAAIELLDHYAGHHDTEEDFAYDLCESLGLLENLPTILHINWTATARTLLIDYHTHHGHYFHA